ncbi:MAG: histidine ammonia-lyase [Planctomycetes bacterium]|nr:histidine ammonia-lyase [Planctomycetota bacterium]
MTVISVKLDGSMTAEDVLAIAFGRPKIELDADALDRVDRAAQYVADKANAGEVVYGVTTGFGKNSDVILPSAEAAVALQRNLIISHAVCVGDPLPTEVVRAILAIRIGTLLRGHSGMRRSTLRTLADMLERGVHPIIPEKGSCGASGDLAPLSHVGLVLIGLGEAEYEGHRLPGGVAMQRAGLESCDLTYKEGLALINTTALMTALGVLAAGRLQQLLRTADLAAAMTTEAIAGRGAAFDERVHRLRAHPGQLVTAANLRKLLAGSTLIDIDPEAICRTGGDWTVDAQGHFHGGKSRSPQDSYSLRCVPQIHGAVRDTLAHLSSVLDRELDSVTDNPLLFPEDDAVISGGNFHGMPLALALAAVKNGIPVLASLSERRFAKLVDGHTNDGLPFFLIDNADGIQSGFMLVQYTAAALVNDLIARAHPASTHSIPTCANFEDHVSMGANEARHVHSMLDDLERVLALELIGAAQALDLRLAILARKLWRDGPSSEKTRRHAERIAAEKHRPSPATRRTLDHFRRRIPFLDRDRELRHDIDAAIELVRDGSLLAEADAECGGLE